MGQYSTAKAPECKKAVLSPILGLGKPGILGRHSTFEAGRLLEDRLSFTFLKDSTALFWFRSEKIGTVQHFEAPKCKSAVLSHSFCSRTPKSVVLSLKHKKKLMFQEPTAFLVVPQQQERDSTAF